MLLNLTRVRLDNKTEVRELPLHLVDCLVSGIVNSGDVDKDVVFRNVVG